MKRIIISESQIRAILPLLHESKCYDISDIGGVNCTLNFDDDDYQEWLAEYDLQDSPEVKTQFIKDYCTYDIEYLTPETFHCFDYDNLTYDEILNIFGDNMGMAMIEDCMDGREHSFETLEYIQDEDVDLNNPVALNAAAKKYMRSVGEPTGQFRGFILSDGTVLDAGWDHIACTRIPGVKSREHFVQLGNIRFSYTGLEMAKFPTPEQLGMLRIYCEYHQNDTIYLDLIDPNIGRGDFRYDYGVEYEDLYDDIYNYFAHGIKNHRNSIYEGLDVSNNILAQLEAKYGVTLSDNGRRWFMGLVNGTPFGLNMDTILTKVAFHLLGINPFPIGQDVANEWDELDGILRIIMEKTGFGSQILERLRESKQNEEMYISESEMAEFEKRLQYYPNLLKELKRCYYVFSTLAPVVYKAKNYLRTYKKGMPALEFCFVVGAIKEKERAATDVAISKALSLPKVSLSLPDKNAINENMNLYHGTRADFNKFDTAYLLSGLGEMAHGYGFYLTDSEATANDYAAGGQVLTVEVPNGKYLDSASIKPSEALTIARQFYKYYLNTEYGQSAYKGMENDFWEYECSAIAKSPNGEYVYNTISTFLGSDKEASEWLRGIGYVGMRMPTENGRTGEPFVNYLIFNPEDMHIVKKQASL